VLDTSAYNGTFGLAVKEKVPNAWTLNIQPVASMEFHVRSTGGFSLNYAGLANYMQAVPYDGLRSVFAQGQVGLYHDWCYMFPNYPRVFDLIHVRDLHVSHQSCLNQIILELDRLLRPGGYIVLCGEGLPALLMAKDQLEAIGSELGWEIVGEGEATLPRGGDSASFRVLRKLGGTFPKTG
jgi:SAM-dependent methyltransferase